MAQTTPKLVTAGRGSCPTSAYDELIAAQYSVRFPRRVVSHTSTLARRTTQWRRLLPEPRDGARSAGPGNQGILRTRKHGC